MRLLKRIKKLHIDDPRNLCWFTIGINTAFRAGEICAMRVGDVDYLKEGDLFVLRQSKTKDTRGITVNKSVAAALDAWLSVHPDKREDAPLFPSRKGGAITVGWMGRMVKAWCADVGLRGNYSTHTMRKTWGYHQRVQLGTHLSLLTKAYGHATEAQTLQYLCIQEDEIKDLYGSLEL